VIRFHHPPFHSLDRLPVERLDAVLVTAATSLSRAPGAACEIEAV
jgi:hypothetical protein